MRNKLNLTVYIVVIAGALFSCAQKENQQKATKSPQWRKMSCGLYMSPDGQIGFASNPYLLNKDKSELKGEMRICENRFLTTFGQDTVTLTSVIDTNTFIVLGADFYKDNSHLYFHYDMCDGGYFNIFADDTTSFKVLSSVFVSYKGQIYHHRNGLMDADYNSFKTSPEVSPLAKDKNGYFEFDERVSREELEKNIPKEKLEKLDQL